MIRINLLPVKEEKLVTAAKGFLLVVVAILISLIVLLVINSSILSKKEEDAKLKIAEISNEIEILKKNIGEIEKLKEKKKRLQEQIGMIDKLQKENVGPVRVLDELSLKMPSNKIWLESLVFSGSTINLEGKTLENKEVADMMKQIERSMFFSLVELRKIQKENVVNGVPILKYTLQSKVHISGDDTMNEVEQSDNPMDSQKPADNAAKPANAQPASQQVPSQKPANAALPADKK